VRVRALSIHADYGCRSSGDCCRSAWPIPVEPPAEDRIRAGLSEGRLSATSDWARPAEGLPHGARVTLRVLASGACVFLEHGAPRLCAVHRQLGEDALASACRHFPRVATLTPSGVSLTLSHYCPTAAGTLFRDDVALAVVSDPKAFPPSWPYEGLDARHALPPLLRPGVLSSWSAHDRLEERAVALFADESLSVERALATLAGAAEALRCWTPSTGAYDDFAERVHASAPVAVEPAPASLAAALGDWERAASAVPRGNPLPDSPRAAVERLGRARAQALVDRGSSAQRRAVGRWLAAKAFASWLALQGEGVRTWAAGLALARSVLRCEAARVVAEAGGAPLDAERLKQAVRRADLLLVHLVDPQQLARALSRCETRP